MTQIMATASAAIIIELCGNCVLETEKYNEMPSATAVRVKSAMIRSMIMDENANPSPIERAQ